MVSRDSKIYNFARSLFLLITMRSGLLAEISWSVCMSKSHRSLCAPFSRTTVGWCIYHLFVCSDLNFLNITQWITLPTQSCLVLYLFYANLLHLLMMWLIVSSLSPHNNICYFVASYLFSLWFVWFLWRCFVLQLGEIMFLFYSFIFLATARLSRPRCTLLVV